MKMTLNKTWKDGVLTIAFQNRDAEGKVVGSAAEPLTFDPSKASDPCRAKAAEHGWEQRLGDAAAMSKDTKTGLPASVEDKRNAVKALIDHYEGGSVEWNLRGRQPIDEDKLLEMLLAKKGLVAVPKAE